MAKGREKKAEKTGRLVLNHSTHVQGLIPVLKRLVNARGIQTVTPAVISRARSNAPKLRLKVSVPIAGGFKLLARKGKTVQEVFAITTLTQEELETAIAQVLGS